MSPVSFRRVCCADPSADESSNKDIPWCKSAFFFGTSCPSSGESFLANPIRRYTELTVTDPEELRQRWRTVREEGAAFDRGEWNLEIPAVAVPVFDHQRRLRGSMAIATPVERTTDELMHRYAELLKAAAAQIAQKLE